MLEETFFVSSVFYLFPDAKSFFSEPTYFLLLIGTEVVLVSCIKNIVTYATARVATLLGERISIDICHEIMSRFLYKDYAWHLSSESKETFQCMQWRNDVANMLNFQLGLYTCSLTMIVLFFLLMGKEPMLTSMVLLLTVVIGIILYASIRRSVDRAAHTIRQAAAAENRAVLCAIRGIRDVLIYRQQETFLNAITRSATRAVPSRVSNSITPTMPTWVLETTAFVAVVLALAYIIFVEHAGIPRIAEALSLLVLTAWRVLPFVNRASASKLPSVPRAPWPWQCWSFWKNCGSSLSIFVQNRPATLRLNVPSPLRTFRFGIPYRRLIVCMILPSPLMSVKRLA